MTTTNNNITDNDLGVKVLRAAAPVALFQGYNSVSGDGCSMAVDGESKDTGAKTDIICSICSNSFELAQSLGIDQSFSLGIKSIISVDEKVKLVNSLKISSYSTSIVVRVRHVKNTTTAISAKLNKDITAPIADKEKKDFVRTYGDSFLDSLTYGGEYCAIYVFYNESREEQLELEASITASGIFRGVSVNTAFQMNLNTLIKNCKTRSVFHQLVSGISSPRLPVPDGIVNYALAFPSINLDAPVIISFTTRGYETIGGFGEFQPIKKNRAYFVGDAFNKGLLINLVIIEELLNQISSITSIYSRFGGFSDNGLISFEAALRQGKKEIIHHANTFDENPLSSFSTPILPALDKAPALNYRFNTSQSWGGNGGHATALNTTVWGKLRPQLVAIQLRSGSRIDQLLLTYKDKLGRETKEVYGGDNGKPGGNLGQPLFFQEGERINNISGRSGSRLDNIDIMTNFNNHVTGGGKGGGPFNMTIPQGEYVIGFNIRSGNEVDQIQVITVSFLPAKRI